MTRQGQDGASSEAPQAPRGCTHFKLKQLQRAVGRIYDRELQQAGLKGTQFSLLAMLDSLGAVQPGQIARQMSLDASTLTRNLQPAIQAGWIAVSPGTNGRNRLLTITQPGREKLIEARTYWRRAQRAVNELLGSKAVAELHGLIDQSMQRLAALADPSRLNATDTAQESEPAST